jgi:hypothetical protein
MQRRRESFEPQINEKISRSRATHAETWLNHAGAPTLRQAQGDTIISRPPCHPELVEGWAYDVILSLSKDGPTIGLGVMVGERT